MRKNSSRSVKVRLTRCRAAIMRAEATTFEVGPARNALILALAHVKDAQRHVRFFTKLTGHVLLCALISVYLVAVLSSCTTTQPVAATGEVDGGKRGTATVVKVCGFVLAGDGSVKTAANNGAVRFVQMVDVRRTSIFGLVTWSTTIVTGE